jgi:two-component system, LytTR family, sensor kinase
LNRLTHFLEIILLNLAFQILTAIIKMRYFSPKVYWTVQLSWWLFTTLVLRYPTTKYFNDPSIKFIYLIVSFLLGLLLTHSYTHFFSQKIRNSKTTILYGIVGTIVTGTSIFLLDYYFDFQRYRKPSEGIPLETYDYFQFFVESIRYVGLWFLFFHLLISNHIAQYKELALAQSEASLKSAELANLKNQLNPHFLFNAINSIKALTISDPNLARNALTELSQLLRTSLTIGNEQLVNLESEVSFVKDYLFLEKLRYENRLHYSFDIDKNTLNVKIPPMSLQLLVENAIKHGIGKSKAGGEIHIKTEMLVNNNFTLTVTNSGKLRKEHSSTGVGIKNLEKRLFLNFQEKASFIVTEHKNHVIASISIIGG